MVDKTFFVEEIEDYLCSCLSEILLIQDDPLPLCLLLSQQNISGLENVAKTLLRQTKVCVTCVIMPLEQYYRRIFLLDCILTLNLFLSLLRAFCMTTAHSSTMWFCITTGSTRVFSEAERRFVEFII